MTESRTTNKLHTRVVFGIAVMGLFIASGCAPTFYELRVEGQRAMAERNWGLARQMLVQAHQKQPEDKENLHDLGVCSTQLAARQMEMQNGPAARRELERAVDYYSRAIAVDPSYRPAIMGKNRAQELEGQFEDALETAHWAARYVGPSADQFIYLGQEYEERGDLDNAFLRYRQAVALEPRNGRTHRAIGLIYLRVGNEEAAKDALLRSLRCDPTQQDVAAMLRELGEPVPAVEYAGDEGMTME